MVNWQELETRYGPDVSRVRAICEAEGFEPYEVRVLQFADPADTRPWYYQDSTELGRVLAIRDGAVLLDRATVHAVARSLWGDSIALIY
jgi:hypothetical protein